MPDVGLSFIHNLHIDLFYAFEANNLTPRHFVNWLFHHKPNLPKDKLWLWLTGQTWAKSIALEVTMCMTCSHIPYEQNCR